MSSPAAEQHVTRHGLTPCPWCHDEHVVIEQSYRDGNGALYIVDAHCHACDRKFRVTYTPTIVDLFDVNGDIVDEDGGTYCPNCSDGKLTFIGDAAHCDACDTHWPNAADMPVKPRERHCPECGGSLDVHVVESTCFLCRRIWGNDTLKKWGVL